MPRERNRAARIAVPIVAVLLGALVIFSILRSGSQKPAPAPAPQASPAQAAPTGEEPAPNGAVAATNAGAPEQADVGGGSPIEAQPAPAAAPAEPLTGLRARAQAPGAEPAAIGSTAAGTDYELQVEFTPWGAGVESITLADVFPTVRDRIASERARRRGLPDTAPRYALQRARTLGADTARPEKVASLAARAVEIDGQTVDLFSSPEGPVWRETGPGAFEAVIEDGSGREIARFTKRFDLRPGSHEIRVEQEFVNLSGRALTVRFFQYGPVDLPTGDEGYGGDKRRVVFGALLPPSQDPSRQFVAPVGSPIARQSVVKAVYRTGPQVLWPRPDAPRRARELVWGAMANRYFAFAVHHPLDTAEIAAGRPVDKRFAGVEAVWAILLAPGAGETLALQLNGPVTSVAPGGSLDLSVAAYAGPKWEAAIRANPSAKAAGLDGLILYNFGGMCAWCTFQPLAQGLLWFLNVLHDYVVFDWAIAIMILVCCVRIALHPVTRRSQIGLARFSKQMQALAPKQKAVQEKYKDDPKKMREEMARLMREEGVNFTGALGCLPMFLQSPIWIALYAMLFFAFELRHEPAFFGVVQALTGGRWVFLGDLSAPDHFIWAGRALFTLPLMGPIEGFNLLPIVLGGVFFIQQKYLTPPPSAAMTPEQRQQQQIIKWMMVVMFPLFMYNAPSGLTIYFLTNSTLGILESRHIRAHINTLDLSAKRPPGRMVMGAGAFVRRRMAEAQKRAAEKRRGQAGGKGARGKR